MAYELEVKEAGTSCKDARASETAAMTMMIPRGNANSPAQAVKSRARGPTITQLRAKQAALVAAAELAASSNAEASVVRHSPVDEAKRWASGKGRKVGFAKARATFRGGGTGIAATAAKHDSLIKKARWRGTERPTTR